MLGRQTCTDCGRLSPEAHGENTLTTSFGWRIRRAQLATGEGMTEWRCPPCWQRFKAARPSDAPPSSASAAPAAKGWKG